MERSQSTANSMDIEQQPPKSFACESPKGIRLVNSSTLLAAGSYHEKIEVKDIEKKVCDMGGNWLNHLNIGQT